MGREGEKVFTSFAFPAHAEGDPDPRMDFNTVLDKFNAHSFPSGTSSMRGENSTPDLKYRVSQLNNTFVACMI